MAVVSGFLGSLLLLLALGFLIPSSSPQRVHPFSTLPSVQETIHRKLEPRFSSSSSSSLGPILTEGQSYSHVCVPKRFKAIGLDMSEFAYCNKSLTYFARVRSLVGSMALAEKIGQLGDQATGVERIGLPKYNWWAEALHGISNVGHATQFDDVVPGATSFATVITSAASFNETLWKSIGEVVSTEARAMHNLGRTGLTFWSPNINVVRDPRWGRTLETPGEDPFVVGKYAVNFVRGLQDVKGHEVSEDMNTRPLKVSSCCKHYAAYDVDNWYGVDRYHFDARVTEQDMVETFLRPFEMCVKEGDVSSVMCSYNRVNGIPTCADPRLLLQTVRGDWNLRGYIVSDCDSLDTITSEQKWLSDTPEDAVQQALRAGLDLDCGDYYPNYAGTAIEKGKLREADIDNALKNLYLVLMRLGFFDGMPQYAKLGKDDICTYDNIQLAADSARQGIVLLKNNNKMLPLHDKEIESIALVGPHANATSAMIGNYAGVPCRFVSPLDAFSSEEVKVLYKLGCDVLCKNESLIFPAMRAAKKADATIIFAGLDLSVEAESLDRTDLLLPGYQTQMIRQVAQAAKGPVVLVIFSGGGIDISFAKDNPDIDAILWAGYPGAEGGRAIADVIFGRYNPGGRLPVTWYESDYCDMLPMTSMPFRPIDDLGYPGRTYKFFNGSSVYPFGYGLSYTQFNYTITNSPSRLVAMESGPHHRCQTLDYKPGSYVPPCPAMVTDNLGCTEEIKFDVEVSNTGERDGSHVVIVYAVSPSDTTGAPRKQVVDFKRVFVPAGESRTVSFKINVCNSLRIVEKTAYMVLPAGKHSIQIGDGESAVSFLVNVDFH